jgi:nucleoside-diphosphate-sugar epimerase
VTQRIMVTGALGFIGRTIVAQLAAISGVEVLALTRQAPTNPVAGAKYLLSGDISEQTQWQPLLAGVHVLIHTAARAHVLNDRAPDPLAEFRRINVAGTLRLAEQAAAMGVKRFVFLSSVGVHGMQSFPGKVFTEADKPRPHNAYAQSKLEAEQGLLRIADETSLEVVVIRPPLVYGPNAPGNFGALVRAVQRAWPLPLGAVHNQRSLVALDNLVDFIITCTTHPLAANQTFLVSDGQDISTTQLIRGMAQAAGVSARLLPVPVPLLRAAAGLMDKTDVVDRLCGNLQVDISKARNLLNWVPPLNFEEGLKRVLSPNEPVDVVI